MVMRALAARYEGWVISTSGLAHSVFNGTCQQDACHPTNSPASIALHRRLLGSSARKS